MEIVLLIETKNYPKVRDMLLKDPVISLASIVFKNAKILGKGEGYYCYISGLDSQCNKALELIKVRDKKTGEIIELAREIKDKEKEEVINKIKEEEKKALEGFGSIL